MRRKRNEGLIPSRGQGDGCTDGHNKKGACLMRADKEMDRKPNETMIQ